jgi:protein gp37
VKKGLLPKECNYWFGSTVTTESETFWWSNIHNSFVSIEPMRGPFEALESPVKKTDWVIMGAETGPRKNKVLPERDWLEAVIKNCRATDTPVFLKNNLADIWGGPLTQEWPNAILEHINRRHKNAN